MVVVGRRGGVASWGSAHGVAWGVAGRGSRVAGRGSWVASRRSRVAGWGSRVAVHVVAVVVVWGWAGLLLQSAGSGGSGLHWVSWGGNGIHWVDGSGGWRVTGWVSAVTAHWVGRNGGLGAGRVSGGRLHWVSRSRLLGVARGGLHWVAWGGSRLHWVARGAGDRVDPLLVWASVSLVGGGDGDGLSTIRVDTRSIERSSGEAVGGRLGVDGGGRGADGDLASGRSIDGGGLDNVLGGSLAVDNLGGDSAVGNNHLSSALGHGVLSTVDASLASSGSLGNLSSVVDGLGDGHGLGGNSVDTRGSIGGNLRSWDTIRLSGLAGGALAASAGLDPDGLSIAAVLADTRAREAGEGVGAELAIRSILDDLSDLVVAASAVLLVVGASWRRASGVLAGRLGRVNGDLLVHVGDADSLVVVVLDGGRDVDALTPLGAGTIRCGDTGRVGLALLGDGHWRRAVSRGDGSVAGILGGAALHGAGSIDGDGRSTIDWSRGDLVSWGSGSSVGWNSRG